MKWHSTNAQSDTFPNIAKFWLLLALLVVTWNSQVVEAADLPALTAGNTPVELPVTFNSYWQWHEGNEPEKLYLLGVASPDMPNTPHVALVAVKDTKGWIPTWRLQLESSWEVDGGSGVIPLANTSISESDQLKVSLSYHSEAKILSLTIVKQNTASQLVAKAFRVVAPKGAIIPVASASISGGPMLQEMQVYYGYQPLADILEIGERQSEGELVPLTTFDGSGEAAIRITSPVPAPGEYHVALQYSESQVEQTNASRIELATVSPIKEINWVQLPLQQLPRGVVTLHIDYLENGKTLASTATKLTLGKVAVAYNFSGVDKKNSLVAGDIAVSSPVALTGVNLEVRAQYSRLTWDESSLSYTETPWTETPLVLNQSAEALRGATPYHFALPMPVAVGLWKVALKANTSPEIASSISNTVEYYNNTPTQSDYWIAVTDQASSRIRVYDPQEEDWNKPEASKWSWQPTTALGYDWYELSQWGGPSDVKLRNNTKWGGQWVIATAGSLATVAAYPSGTKKWAVSVGSGSNPHSIELLPNGNTAIAASTGGWVRLYTSSQGPSSSFYTEFALPGAHGVLWDPKLDLLWAVGDYLLVGLKVKGTDNKPELVKVIEKRLPSNWGHDLSPVYGDTDRLWVTSGSAVYQYIKSKDVWITAYPGASMISRNAVKAVGNQLSGQVVQARQKPGTLYVWTTDTVDFFTPRDTRTIKGVSFYKARVWSPDYQ